MERLFLQAQFYSAPAQFTGAEIDFEHSEPHDSAVALRHDDEFSIALQQRYNISVPLQTSQPGPLHGDPSHDDPSHDDPPQDDPSHKHHRHAAYASEATGLLLIAALLLVLTLIRYWHHLHWSLR